MTDQQIVKLLWLLERDESACVEYGIISQRWDQGEYIHEDTLEARKRDMREARQAIVEYLKSIQG